MFSDVLMTVDFDRTMTGPDSKIPQRNLDAVAFFMENGGTFTVNTGRSVSSFHKHLGKLPVNAPVLMYNGSARWDNGVLSDLKLLDFDLWETVKTVRTLFPDMNLEIQGTQYHDLVEPEEAYAKFYEELGWPHRIVKEGDDLGPFVKFALAGSPRSKGVATLFECTPEEMAAFDAAQAKLVEMWGDKIEVYRAASRIIDVHAKGVSKAAAARKLQKKLTLRKLYGDKVDVYRAAPRIVDVHAKGVSKIAAARRLQQELGKKILVCVGDAENDLPMLEGADYAYAPADGVVADRFENVCNCADGAVADVIYKKIPEILGLSIDIA